MASHAPAQGAHDAHAEHHPTPADYVRIAIILAIITLVEVIIYYLPAMRPILVPILLVLSIVKFLAVVGYFMHLKDDKRLFRLSFAAGLVLSLAVFLALIAMFWTTTSWAPHILPFVS
ncbi:MAG: cytochrome C oxidase subunit IV family protein [Chloroflexota bacterium]|nr:cytochrome C oxidase subunit IV family protein [Chloroflexota bacterium]